MGTVLELSLCATANLSSRSAWEMILLLCNTRVVQRVFIGGTLPPFRVRVPALPLTDRVFRTTTVSRTT